MWKNLDFCDIMGAMDIKELDKKQLILLTLLITFVVSIATGIVTVSLMNQAPKSVPQTINNVIQRTIEKVSTVETTSKTETQDPVKENQTTIGSGDVLIPIYPSDSTANGAEVKEIGQGILISDSGLLLIESGILTDASKYKVVLNKIDFDATVLKKFENGFAILQISEKGTATPAEGGSGTGAGEVKTN